MFKRFTKASVIAQFALLPLLSSTTLAAEPATSTTPVAEQATTTPAPEQLAEEQAYINKAQAFWDALNRQTGEIKLANNAIALNVPESFYFLDSKDAEKVLVDVWGNRPGQNVLGMLMPSQYTPFDEASWGVTITYEQDGYVSDEDAHSLDYDELLETMKEDTRSASEELVAQGYEAIELVGWASKPYYDVQAKKLHWAKELKFGTTEQHTLNYNVRMLGRKGVLVLNFIAGMEQKTEIDQNLDTVMALADFAEGSRYSDFNPDVDEVAAYGIGALIAGKVIAKTGLIAMLIMIFKKFGVFIVVGIGALVARLFKRDKTQETGQT